MFNNITFFEKEYEKELVIKDSINSNNTNILTLITINLTILSYYVVNTDSLFFPEHITIWYILCYLFIYCYLIYLLKVILELYNFYFSDDRYMKIPYANDMYDYFKELQDYDYKNLTSNINDYLLKFYIQATTHNSQLNEKKSALQFEIRRLLLYKFIILFLLFIPFYVIKEGKLNTYSVKIEPHTIKDNYVNK